MRVIIMHISTNYNNYLFAGQYSAFRVQFSISRCCCWFLLHKVTFSASTDPIYTSNKKTVCRGCGVNNQVNVKLSFQPGGASFGLRVLSVETFAGIYIHCGVYITSLRRLLLGVDEKLL